VTADREELMSQPFVATAHRRRSEPKAGKFVPPVAADAIEAAFDQACERDPLFDDHSTNVTALATAVGRHLGLTRGRIEILGFAALVHDLGKGLVPAAVIAKEGPLDDEEWQLMRNHPAAGAQILVSCSAPPQVVAAVRSHHERWDGTGYPARLAGREIPLAGRIISAADAYCAMIEPRSYRAPRTPAAARAEMLANAGTQFDVDCARAVVAVTAA
jgi:putative nucleotidyltransferase with HDIG domain